MPKKKKKKPENEPIIQADPAAYDTSAPTVSLAEPLMLILAKLKVWVVKPLAQIFNLLLFKGNNEVWKAGHTLGFAGCQVGLENN